MEYIYDTIILGGGPAGCTAALYASRAGLNTLLIERIGAGGQMTQTGDIDNYPGFENGIDGFELGMKMQKGAERFGAKMVYAEVVSVNFSESVKKILTSNGAYLAKTVIIATGANPRPLGIEGEPELVGRGVHYCAHCDGRFYKDKTVVVVGGGNSAAEDALYLSRLAQKVYLVHRRDELRAAKIYQNALFNAKNIDFVWNSTVSELVANEKLNAVLLKNVKTQDTVRLECDAVFASIGRIPVTDFLNNALMLDKDRYIVADESTKTDVEGVFAAGDIRTKSLRQVITAASDGAVAAHSAEQYLAEIEI